MNPTAGALLVATTALDDPHFLRSVVWLAEHGEDGTLGFIINRPLDLPLTDLWEGCPLALTDLRCAAEGGPVERNKGLLVHGMGNLLDAVPLHQGLYVGGDLEALSHRWREGADAAGPRLFLGHSGWAPGQLEREIAAGSWVVRPGSLEQVLVPPVDGDALWKALAVRRPTDLGPSLN